MLWANVSLLLLIFPSRWREQNVTILASLCLICFASWIGKFMENNLNLFYSAPFLFRKDLWKRQVGMTVLRHLIIFFKVNNEDDKARCTDLLWVFIFKYFIFWCARKVLFKLLTIILHDGQFCCESQIWNWIWNCCTNLNLHINVYIFYSSNILYYALK